MSKSQRPPPTSSVKRSRPTLRYSFIRILTGSDLSRRRLPLMHAVGGLEGPNVWITACAHGDEVGGMAVIHEVFKQLKRGPQFHGEVRAFPLLNPLGFDASSRHVSFSEEDLNRAFPGNAEGSLAQRLAQRIFSAITETQPAFVLDLHNDWIRSIPYVVLDMQPKDGTPASGPFRKACEIAKVLSLPIVQEHEVIAGALSHHLLEAGVAALTIELGEAHVVNERNVALGVALVLDVLSALNMIDRNAYSPISEAADIADETMLMYNDQPVSSTSGIIRFLVHPGMRVRKDQPVARIVNAFGKVQQTLRAPADALVLGYTDSAVAYPGAPVMAFGTYGE
ncbi:MAG: succinylglutamate desuccinylase/aspartoacylase family protein [Phycisphaerales bacterium]